MTENINSIGRFVSAHGFAFSGAISEISGGKKRNHWMWYVFPQLRGLGRSPNATFYGIADIEEARAFLAHPTLGKNLREISNVLLSLPEECTAESVFGTIDALKLHSSMTLFAVASGEQSSVFDGVLTRYFGGERDARTLELLKTKNKPQT